MRRIIAAVNLKVLCANGDKHEGVTLAVENRRRIYLTADGTELQDVKSISKCVSALPPMLLAAVLASCEECDQ